MTIQNLVLKIEEIDPYQFVNTQFPLNILLVDSTTDQPKLSESYNLTMFASFEDPISRQGYKESIPDIIEVISNSNIQPNGLAETLLKFKEVSMSKQNKRFVIVAEAYSKGENVLIARGTSNPITCVKHKLIIQEESLVPYSWYKDEGGKDKCIELKALLVDSNKCLVRDRFVPLRALLTYSGGQPVQQQNILALSPDSRVCIDESGSARFKIRINEVSNRHRGQMFQVLISPDLSQLPTTADISPALSVPVEVKSKRNASSKKTESGGNGNGTVNTGGSMGIFGLQSVPLYNPGLMMSGMQQTQALQPLDMSYGGGYGNPKRVKTSGLFSDQPLMIGSAGTQLLYSGNSSDMSSAAQMKSNSSALSAAMAECEALHEDGKAAFKLVVDWTQQVLSALQKMQWIQVGYEVPPHQPLFPANGEGREGNGGLAESKPSIMGGSSGTNFNFALFAAGPVSTVPLYNMSNPNEQIREVVSKYREATKEALGVLKDFLDRQPKLLQLQTAQMQTQQAQLLQQSSSGAPFSLLQSNPMYGDYHNQPLSTYQLPSISSGLAGTHSSYSNLPSLLSPPFNATSNLSFDSVMQQGGQKTFTNSNPTAGGINNSLFLHDHQSDAINLLTFSSSNADADLLETCVKRTPRETVSKVSTSSQSLQSGPPPLVEEEQDVNLILARNVYFNNLCIGMPAFSSSSVDCSRSPEIRGFYIQSEQDICASSSCSGEQTFTQLFFKPASKVPAMKREELTRQIHDMLKAEMMHVATTSISQTYSSAVFQLDTHGFDLLVMRERALCSCLLSELEPLLDLPLTTVILTESSEKSSL